MKVIITTIVITPSLLEIGAEIQKTVVVALMTTPTMIKQRHRSNVIQGNHVLMLLITHQDKISKKV